MDAQNSVQTAAAVCKYATIPHSFRDIWDEVDVELAFRFSKPTKTQMKRLMDTATRNSAQASRDLLLSTIHPEEKQTLSARLDEYPGLAGSYSNALLKAVGLSADVGN